MLSCPARCCKQPLLLGQGAGTLGVSLLLPRVFDDNEAPRARALPITPRRSRTTRHSRQSDLRLTSHLALTLALETECRFVGAAACARRPSAADRFFDPAFNTPHRLMIAPITRMPVLCRYLMAVCRAQEPQKPQDFSSVPNFPVRVPGLRCTMARR